MGEREGEGGGLLFYGRVWPFFRGEENVGE